MPEFITYSRDGKEQFLSVRAIGQAVNHHGRLEVVVGNPAGECESFSLQGPEADAALEVLREHTGKVQPA